MGNLLPGTALLVLLVASIGAAPQPQMGERLPDDPEIENLTRSVLSQPEFQRESSRGWWAVVYDFVTHWLSEWLGDGSVNFRRVSAGLGLFLLIAMLLLVGYTLSVLLPELGLGNPVQSLGNLKRPGGAWRSLEGAAGSWEEAIWKARQAAAEGRFYDAVWIAHRALLSLLDQREVVDFAKWKTNLDYLGECPVDDPAYPLFDTVSRAYDQVVYAHQSISPDRLNGLLNEIESARRDEGK